jgi:hypothetical protein
MGCWRDFLEIYTFQNDPITMLGCWDFEVWKIWIWGPMQRHSCQHEWNGLLKEDEAKVKKIMCLQN